VRTKKFRVSQGLRKKNDALLAETFETTNISAVVQVIFPPKILAFSFFFFVLDFSL